MAAAGDAVERWKANLSLEGGEALEGQEAAPEAGEADADEQQQQFGFDASDEQPGELFTVAVFCYNESAYLPCLCYVHAVRGSAAGCSSWRGLDPTPRTGHRPLTLLARLESCSRFPNEPRPALNFSAPSSGYPD